MCGREKKSQVPGWFALCAGDWRGARPALGGQFVAPGAGCCTASQPRLRPCPARPPGALRGASSPKVALGVSSTHFGPGESRQEGKGRHTRSHRVAPRRQVGMHAWAREARLEHTPRPQIRYPGRDRAQSSAGKLVRPFQARGAGYSPPERAAGKERAFLPRGAFVRSGRPARALEAGTPGRAAA
ncbi:lactosylceramide 1,3-N-acetyl-beta-D-glucosaminyltransferase isoform X2 [Choloepus didactylus]|uniref:lactosylceramide 1,3-N-acetyl-beta-D-glucosaminyltransferase isoform X2 n=1 Tax=Choloepus didactylus TaxID=27675 RepID=UPI00189EAF3A|nr:lactosylceramide 1,3-N-acetyl-beta-D-glucosaminyltransferase isoform X2 [Choloepus didactylus]